MRQMISGLVAAIAVMAASAAPAIACGGGLFQGGCSPCGQAYVSPCAQPEAYVPPVYVPPAPVYTGCNSCGGGWSYEHERLPDPVTEYHSAEPVHQYYYVNQGPTYTGPGDVAPYPVYREGGYGYRHYHHHYGYAHHGYGYGYAHHGYGYGYHRGYAPHFYAMHHRSMRYGAPMGMPRAYGHREMYGHGMRRYN